MCGRFLGTLIRSVLKSIIESLTPFIHVAVAIHVLLQSKRSRDA